MCQAFLKAFALQTCILGFNFAHGLGPKTHKATALLRPQLGSGLAPKWIKAKTYLLGLQMSTGKGPRRLEKHSPLGFWFWGPQKPQNTTSHMGPQTKKTPHLGLDWMGMTGNQQQTNSSEHRYWTRPLKGLCLDLGASGPAPLGDHQAPGWFPPQCG